MMGEGGGSDRGSYLYPKNHNFSGFFSRPKKILIAYWLGFGIFKQNQDNPDEIRMVGQSGILIC